MKIGFEECFVQMQVCGRRKGLLTKMIHYSIVTFKKLLSRQPNTGFWVKNQSHQLTSNSDKL